MDLAGLTQATSERGKTCGVLLLKAIYREWRGQPSFLYGRTIEAISGELVEQEKLTQGDVEEGVNWLYSNKLVEVLPRSDGHVVHPTESGLAVIREVKEKKISILAGLLAFLGLAIFCWVIFSATSHQL